MQAGWVGVYRVCVVLGLLPPGTDMDDVLPALSGEHAGQ
jgi:hypothetical protein